LIIGSHPSLSESEIRQLQQESYNAEVVEFRAVHESLAVLRVRPDWGRLVAEPGQYTVLGLGNWEPRVARAHPEDLDEAHLRRVTKRAYSFSSSMLFAGEVRRVSETEHVEFYVTLIDAGNSMGPSLTPRLFALRPGDRLFLGPKSTGRYTLAGVHPEQNIVLLSTGTGEAPHNTMVAELLASGHAGRVVAVTSVRQFRDLAYLSEHRELERLFPNYRYVPLTTREPENLDPSLSNYVGKRYLQDYIASGDFTREAGLVLRPEETHVYLCGNPAMIGAPLRHPQADRRFGSEHGMVELLEQAGFRPHAHGRPGNLHFEAYW
jgi:ferredoxin--NADP+ reductase